MPDKPTYQDLEKKVEELEKALYERELFLNNIPEHVVIQDLEQRVLWANHTAADSVDKKLEDILGQYCYEVWQQRNEPCEECPILKTIKTGKGKELETLTPNGHAYHIHGYPMYDQENKIIGAFEYGRDITKRRHFEKVLRKSEEKYRLLIENQNDFVIHTDSMQKIIYASPNYYNIFGKNEKDLVGYDFKPLIHEEDIGRVKASLESLANPPHTTYHEERAMTVQGWKWLAWSVKAIIDGKGNISEIFATGRDITKLKQTEDVLIQKQNQLEAIIKIGALANSTLDLKFVLKEILKGTVESLNAAAGMIFLKDHDTGCLSWGASLGLSKAFVKGFQDRPVQPGEGLTGIIAHSGKSIYIPMDSSHDPRIVRPLIEKEGLNSFIGVPLYAADKIVGVMNILTHPTDILSEDDMHLCEAIKSHVGMAIHNAQLFDKQKQTEKYLIESENRFRKIYTHMSVGVARISLDFLIESANQAYCQMLGYSEVELIGKHLKEITNPETIEENLRKQSQLVAGKIDYYRMDKQFIHKNGHIVHGILNANLVRNAAGKPLYCLGSVLNITERKRAEDALRESETKYQSIMNSMNDSVYICSSDLVIAYMNPRMVSRVGRDATGDYCYKAIYNSDEKCPWCVFDNILQGDHFDYEFLDPRDNRYYSVTNSPIYHSGGSISKLTIFRDITDNKSIEAELHQARKMESIGTMAGGIAHDFNNIIYMITGNAELAMEDIPAWNPAHENIKEIKSAGLRAADIVKQILTFSRQTAQELKPIGAVMVIKDALKFMRSTIPSSIEIQKEFPDKEVTIHGDPTQINQVMMNLCINASQAMEEMGGVLYILVETIILNEKTNDSYPDRTTGDWLKITVNDTGPGIRPDIVDRIFDPYYTTKDVGKGSGMGLAVVRGIVENHHGTISVESELGKGTSFTIFFPVATERPANDVKVSDVILRDAGERVLFVDDETSITNMTKKMLERFGYKVQTLTNPVDALELFRAKPDAFDLVLTDMTMPKMTGVKLSEKLKEIRPDIPVVICTGHSALIDEEKAKSIGIDGYVMKPIVMKDIAKAIRNVLDKAKGSAQR